jgi:hypothetical protein
MIWNEHLDLVDQHAPFGASQNAWVNYDDEKFIEVYKNKKAAPMGTRLHAFAAEAIRLRRKLEGEDSLAMFVRDAVDLKMRPEQPLWYSKNFGGTADAISFRRGTLRIFDLKTGKNEAHIQQLKVYAAFFCLEYKVQPTNIKHIILRLYQFDTIIEELVEQEEINRLMKNIAHKDRLAKKLDAEEYDL